MNNYATRLLERLYVDLVESRHILRHMINKCVIIYVKLLSSRLKMMQFPINESETPGAIHSIIADRT